MLRGLPRALPSRAGAVKASPQQPDGGRTPSCRWPLRIAGNGRPGVVTRPAARAGYRRAGYSALVASNLACVGLGVADVRDLSNLVRQASATARPAGTFDGVEVTRWQDPSGAALVLGWRAGDVADLLPTYASAVGGRLADCHLVNGSVATAVVVDGEGQQLTAMTFEAEQYRRLKAVGRPVAGLARITALGISITVHRDAGAFAASPDSLLNPAADPSRQPPPNDDAQDWAWPARVGPESFFSYGIFGAPAASTARARLSGTVVQAGHHTCTLTGQGFSVITVRSVGFEAAVCLPDTEHPVTPEPGNVVSGTVVLSAAIDSGDLALLDA